MLHIFPCGVVVTEQNACWVLCHLKFNINLINSRFFATLLISLLLHYLVLFLEISVFSHICIKLNVLYLYVITVLFEYEALRQFFVSELHQLWRKPFSFLFRLSVFNKF